MTNSKHRTLDDVAKALAMGTVSRRQALKLMGASLAGAAAALVVPRVASAAPPEHAGYGEGGRFGKGGPAPGSGTCPSIVCSTNSDCGSGCACAFILSAGQFLCVSTT